MSNIITNIEIEKFVSDVKRELRHLAAEERAELTDNLLDDLLEQQAEQGHTFTLPNAKDFATELASAAGLSLGETEVSRMNLEFFRIWKSVLGYFRTLSPAWAIVRGWLFFTLVYGPIAFGGIREIPAGAGEFVLLAGFAVVSVWLSIKQFRPMRYILVGLNVLLLVASPIVVADVNQAVDTYEKYKIFEITDDLIYQGQPVFALCGQDSYGQKFEVDKLFDEQGYPIFSSKDGSHVC